MTTSMEGELDFGSTATTGRPTNSGDLWVVVALSRRGKAESYMARPRCGVRDDARALHGGAPRTGAGSVLSACFRRRDRRARTGLRGPRPDRFLRRGRRATI